MNNEKEVFKTLMKDNELWLMNQILEYAIAHNYTKYTSTLVEPWRISIEGLTKSFCLLLDQSDTIPEFDPDDNYKDDPASQFGLKEAKLHRSRGVNYAMFTSLLKYYRQSYIDLIEKNRSSVENLRFYKRFMHRFFDRVEIAYATEWNGLSSELQIHELSMKNRDLANEKNFYLTIFESFGSPAFLITENKELINYNSAAATAFNLVESSGYYYYNQNKELVQLDILDTAISQIKEKNSDRIEYFHILTSRYYLVKTQKLKDISGKFYGYVVLFSDTTELHDKDEMLIAQSRLAAMGEILSMVAHQWRQPLSDITMGVNNIVVDIELQTLDNNELSETLQLISDQTNELSNRIDDFKDFFQRDKEKQKITLKEILDDALEVISASFEANSIKVNIEDRSERKVSVYSGELLQVFASIFKNAKEALVENRVDQREIRCLIQHFDKIDKVSIFNNGGNIQSENLKKVFEPYFTTKDEYNGLGLGLYMSKMLIETHLKGEIKLSNTAGGVCIELFIPNI